MNNVSVQFDTSKRLTYTDMLPPHLRKAGFSFQDYSGGRYELTRHGKQVHVVSGTATVNVVIWLAESHLKREGRWTD